MDSQSLDDIEAIDALGGSLALAHKRPSSEFLLGATGRYGWGKTNGLTFVEG